MVVRADYNARMRRVLDYVDRNLERDLSLAELSAVAASSIYHFHRQFTATFGLPVNRYVQLARMRRASYRLARKRDETVTNIALDAGYEAPDAFARAFRRRIGQSPSGFRKSPDWPSWSDAFELFDQARLRLRTQALAASMVTIQHVPETAVARMEHRGDPRSIYSTVQRFIAWRQAVGLRPRLSATFTVFHDDPRATPAAEFRMDLCAATDRPVEPNDRSVVAGLIPGGRCGALRVAGMSENLEPAALFLYRDWLPHSGEELRDFPIYCRRISSYPDVPEGESITDVYLPLAELPQNPSGDKLSTGRVPA